MWCGHRVFVLHTITARARRVIKEHGDVVLSNEAFDRFIAELDDPPRRCPSSSSCHEAPEAPGGVSPSGPLRVERLGGAEIV
jgi:hypothetical protein